MIREVFIMIYMALAFVVVTFLTDAPAWAALIAALIAGMWADIRIRR